MLIVSQNLSHHSKLAPPKIPDTWEGDCEGGDTRNEKRQARLRATSTTQLRPPSRTLEIMTNNERAAALKPVFDEVGVDINDVDADMAMERFGPLLLASHYETDDDFLKQLAVACHEPAAKSPHIGIATQRILASGTDSWIITQAEADAREAVFQKRRSAVKPSAAVTETKATLSAISKSSEMLRSKSSELLRREEARPVASATAAPSGHTTGVEVIAAAVEPQTDSPAVAGGSPPTTQPVNRPNNSASASTNSPEGRHVISSASIGKDTSSGSGSASGSGGDGGSAGGGGDGGEANAAALSSSEVANAAAAKQYDVTGQAADPAATPPSSGSPPKPSSRKNDGGSPKKEGGSPQKDGGAPAKSGALAAVPSKSSVKKLENAKQAAKLAARAANAQANKKGPSRRPHQSAAGSSRGSSRPAGSARTGRGGRGGSSPPSRRSASSPTSSPTASTALVPKQSARPPPRAMAASSHPPPAAGASPQPPLVPANRLRTIAPAPGGRAPSYIAPGYPDPLVNTPLLLDSGAAAPQPKGAIYVGWNTYNQAHC